MTESTDDGTDAGSIRSRSTRARWTLVAGASLISVALGAYEISPASVTPLVRDSLGIGSSAAGLIVSVMFGTAVVASLPVGAVLDRTNSRRAVAVAVLVLFVAGVWGWTAGERGSFASVLGSRVLGGVAYVVVWNAGIDIVSEAVDGARRATAVGVFTASGPVGFAIGQSTAPLIAARFGWPAIFLAFNGLALVGLAVFWPTSRGLGRVGGDAPPSPGEFGDVLRSRAVWTVGLLGFLGYSLYLFVNSWAPSYLTDVVGLSLGVSGLLVAAFPAVGVLARVSSGLLSDRLFGGRRRPVVLASFVVAAPLVASVVATRSVVALLAVLLVAGFAVQLTLGLSFAYVRELVDPRVAATAVAFQTSVGLAGAFAAPIVGGAVIERAGYTAAFLAASALGVLGIVLAWRAPEPGG
ncbi:MFS transporter [Halostella salina]|uniref:MFS transporter n=1 Tax=Halostella salina TaxID=1547897 RepID=UPI000EF77E89|nr:MFS transporter [Halostella salina]